jgi:Holliday junction resolvase RusA-like endonuclease
MQKLIIPGRLPGLNEIINSSRTHWAVAAKQKKDAMAYMQAYITICKIKPVDGFAEITITCYEPNKHRDADNVQAGANKLILDALQQAGIIQGDGQKYIKLFQPPVEVDRENPRVEVEIGERVNDANHRHSARFPAPHFLYAY